MRARGRAEVACPGATGYRDGHSGQGEGGVPGERQHKEGVAEVRGGQGEAIGEGGCEQPEAVGAE